MKLEQTRQGSPYRCQSKASYVALEVLQFISGSAISGGRSYLIEARLPYKGKLAFKCKSKVGFRVDESQVYNKSPELQKKLLHSYMDLRNGLGMESSDLQIERALLPALCAIKDAFPMISVTPGQAISIQVSKTTRWEIPENVVDEVHSILTREAYRLELALAQIESSCIVEGIGV